MRRSSPGWALALCTLLAACGDTRPCKQGTLFVIAKLDAASRGADQITVQVTVGDKAPVMMPFTHSGGRAEATAEVAFDKGYPQGAPVVVSITASKGGTVIGRGTGGGVLGPGCGRLEVEVKAGTAGGAVDGAAPSADAGPGGETDAVAAPSQDGPRDLGPAPDGAGDRPPLADTSVGDRAPIDAPAGDSQTPADGSALAPDAIAVPPDGSAGADAVPPPVDGEPPPDAPPPPPDAAPAVDMEPAPADLPIAIDMPAAPDAPEPDSMPPVLVDAPVDAPDDAPPDLAPDMPPDMGCVFMSAEVCFNGIDDDCNGLVDCADPNCMPTTMCVPAAAGFVLGMQVADGMPCPTGFSAQAATVLNQNLSGGAGCTGCTCSGTNTCTTKLYEYDAAAVCPGGAKVEIASLTSAGAACVELQGSAELNSGKAHVDAFGHSASCAPQGTATVTTPTWGTKTQFCRADGVGAGCSLGYVCVRRPPASAPVCALAGGSMACAPTYSPVSGGTWYKSYMDTRGCGACGCESPVGGDCAGVTVRIWTAGACGGGYSVLNPGATCNLATSFGYDSANVFGPGTPPTCMPKVTQTGALTPAEEHTLCCQ